eukprot:351806-Chlamydomonas_euryale.AAC.2
MAAPQMRCASRNQHGIITSGFFASRRSAGPPSGGARAGGQPAHPRTAICAVGRDAGESHPLIQEATTPGLSDIRGNRLASRCCMIGVSPRGRGSALGRGRRPTT